MAPSGFDDDTIRGEKLMIIRRLPSPSLAKTLFLNSYDCSKPHLRNNSFLGETAKLGWSKNLLLHVKRKVVIYLYGGYTGRYGLLPTPPSRLCGATGAIRTIDIATWRVYPP